MTNNPRPPEPRRRPVSGWRTDLRNYLLAGLLVTLPLAATVFVLRLVFNMADNLLHLLPETYQPDSFMPVRIPGLFGLLLAFGFLVIVGFVTRNYFGQRLVGLYEKLIARIPMVRSIYAAVKQLTTAAFSSDDNRFSRVVIIQYPKTDCFSLAFITSDNAGYLSDRIGRPCVSVFVATTPNPTSGFFLLVPADQIIETDLTVEEAFRLIISAGIAQPIRPDTVAATGPAGGNHE